MIMAGIGTPVQLFTVWKLGANSFAGGVGAADFGSARKWILGTITLVCCILFNIFAKGHLKQLSVLFGLVVGYIVALLMGNRLSGPADEMRSYLRRMKQQKEDKP